MRTLRRAAAEVRYAGRLGQLPPRVAWFQWRAHHVARRTGDPFSPLSATRHPDLAVLLALARQRRRIVELGTGTAWTTLALALANPMCDLITFDPVVRPERERYLRFVDAKVRMGCGLLNAQPLRNVLGRKTNVKGTEWIRHS